MLEGKANLLKLNTHTYSCDLNTMHAYRYSSQLLQINFSTESTKYSHDVKSTTQPTNAYALTYYQYVNRISI